MPTPGPGFNVDPQGNATPGRPATGAYRKREGQITDPYEVAGPTGPQQPLPTQQTVGPVAKIFQSYRNLNTNQFQKQSTKESIGGALDAAAMYKHFRHGSFTNALRYALNLPSMPQHMESFYRAEMYQRGDNSHPGVIVPKREPEPGDND